MIVLAKGSKKRKSWGCKSSSSSDSDNDLAIKTPRKQRIYHFFK